MKLRDLLFIIIYNLIFCSEEYNNIFYAVELNQELMLFTLIILVLVFIDYIVTLHCIFAYCMV